MTDSVNVFDPNFRVTDNATGAPVVGAVIYFYDAGTTNPKTVYADAALSTALGTSVTCDALGCPTSDGSSATLIWVGTASYKVVIKDSSGNTLKSYDNVKGAVAVVDPGSLNVVFSRPVVTKSLGYTVLSTDQSQIFAGNCTGGDVTFTMPSAATVGAGWFITVQHAGSTNQCIVSSVSSQTFSEGSKSFGTSYALTSNGEEVTLVSDGGNWRVTGHASPFLQNGEGILTIVSRTNTPPGSPNQGDLHIVTSSPTGAWSGYSVGDVAKYAGASWINFTPPSNVGWVAWVQAESIQYRYSGSAWVAESATTSLPGTIRMADQTAMEAETASRAVTADVAKYHPSAAKAWVTFNGTGTVAILRAYNVSSITDGGVGTYTVNFTNAFSDGNYTVATAANYGGNTANYVAINTASTSSCAIQTANNGAIADMARISLVFFGDF